MVLSHTNFPGRGADELGAVEEPGDESDGETEGVEERRVAADGVLLRGHPYETSTEVLNYSP